MITPKLYAWKGTKWIRTIEFLPTNVRGFWEERGYSDTAEPWFNDRYNLRPARRPSSRLAAASLAARQRTELRN